MNINYLAWPRAGPGRSRVYSKFVLFSCKVTDISTTTDLCVVSPPEIEMLDHIQSIIVRRLCYANQTTHGLRTSILEAYSILSLLILKFK